MSLTGLDAGFDIGRGGGGGGRRGGADDVAGVR